ncbi:helix-turn-helix domain-containing protein [Abyssisolibacter fermentans]|uniref:helix-turn-helix domain-containing protein n=1 Tax=Abyssisolibacter fermentans TaxID=1766203 RepID=UPI00082ACF58|nr:helix-turn-helix transcriptional regulator [Abyssisolibacter fermentans]
MNSIGKKVREARLNKKMTQSEVAGDFITRNMLSKIENDAAMPSIKTIEYLASVLDKNVSYFLDVCNNRCNEKEDILYENNINQSKINKKLIKELIMKNDYKGIIKEIEKNCIIKGIDIALDIGIVLQKVYIEEAKNTPIQEAKQLYEKANELSEKLFYVPNENYIDISIGLLKCNNSQIGYEKNINNTISNFSKCDKINIYNILKAEKYIILYKKMDKIENKLKRISLIKSILEEVKIDTLDDFWEGKYYYIMSIINEDEQNTYQNMLLKCEEKWSKIGVNEPLIDVYTKLSEHFSKNNDYEKAYYYSTKEKNLLKLRPGRYL